MKISLKELYIEFFMIGLQLLGGGYVIVPLMKKNLVEKKNWITESELTDFYALSQTIPGIIAMNISAFTGYKLRRKSGAFIALLGTITTPVIFIFLIATIMEYLLRISFIQSIFWGIGIAVIILIYLTIKEMWQNSLVDIPSWIIFILAFVLSFFAKLSPVCVIVISLALGILICLTKARLNK